MVFTKAETQKKKTQVSLRAFLFGQMPNQWLGVPPNFGSELLVDEDEPAFTAKQWTPRTLD
jgi:hypothetical protein